MLSRSAILVFVLVCFVFAVRLWATEEADSKVERDPEQLLQLPTTDPQQSDWIYNAMAVNYVALNTMDLITTYKSLEKGAVEVNPVARTFIERKPLAIAFKAGMTGGVLFALGKMKKHDNRAAFITLGILNVVYGVVVANNIGVYLQLN